jgi:dihydropteroate synthase
MFRCGRFAFALDRPLVMGIVNVTPDSFSDGGRYLQVDQAVAHALSLREAGADILDVGGESTRPGGAPVDAAEELGRVLPVVTSLRDAGVALSVDTMKPEVMAAALEAGADMINDVRGFEAPGAWDAVADSDCGLCIMHMRGTPGTMQAEPVYQDPVAEITTYLRQRMDSARAAGIREDRLCIDPGFGFGKTLAHNLALFKNLDRLTDMAPVLVGLSRKSMLGALTGRGIEDRLLPSVVAALLAIRRGAAIVRVHDVRETVDAIKLWRELGEDL